MYFDMPKKKEYRDGEPCDHAGCLSHRTHPCEGCGRQWGKKQYEIKAVLDENTCGYCRANHGSKITDDLKTHQNYHMGRCKNTLTKIKCRCTVILVKHKHEEVVNENKTHII